MTHQNIRLSEAQAGYAWEQLLRLAGMMPDCYEKDGRSLLHYSDKPPVRTQPCIWILPETFEYLHRAVVHKQDGGPEDFLKSPPLPVTGRPEESLPACHVRFSPRFYRPQGCSYWICSCDLLLRGFFLLSRIEELWISERDSYGRFRGKDSLSYRWGFLEVPVLDNFAFQLQGALRRIAPETFFAAHEPQIRFTCDVDHPWDPSADSILEWIKRSGGDLLKRKSPRAAYLRMRNRLRVRSGDLERDPYHTFDWIFNELERSGTAAEFFFIASEKRNRSNGFYDVLNPRLQPLFSKIAGRGHRIGLHGAFGSQLEPDKLVEEKTRLEAALEAAGCPLEIKHCRQHYLLWDAERTPNCYERGGIVEDWTGGFSDKVGFRFGTAARFQLWNWQADRPALVSLVPLPLMESTLIDSVYENLPHFPEAIEKALALREAVLGNKLDFVFLWHNSHLTSSEDRKMLRLILNSPSEPMDLIRER